MKLAVWTVTRGAGHLGKKYGDILKADVFTLKKFQIENTIQTDDFTRTLNENFNKYDGHIFIMATGIVIRKIACLIKSKDIDPAVLVADEGENFIISLLSGHLGGANELANIAAEKLSLFPIITTSSDVTGKIAVDSLAQKIQGELENLEKAKHITSLIVDGKEVNLLLPKNLKIDSNTNEEGVIIVSNKEKIETIRIYPKNLILGIGCKRGTETETIIEGITKAMNVHNLSFKSIKKIATVDLKADETGIIESSKLLEKELIIISREDIQKVEGRFEGSEFVKKQIGVSCVSEPCALLASNGKGKFIENKFIYNGMTVSIYEESFNDE